MVDGDEIRLSRRGRRAEANANLNWNPNTNHDDVAGFGWKGVLPLLTLEEIEVARHLTANTSIRSPRHTLDRTPLWISKETKAALHICENLHRHIRQAIEPRAVNSYLILKSRLSRGISVPMSSAPLEELFGASLQSGNLVEFVGGGGRSCMQVSGNIETLQKGFLFSSNCGSASTGKTQICLEIAAIAMMKNKHVFWVSSSPFPVPRLNELIKLKTGELHAVHPQSPQDLLDTLENMANAYFAESSGFRPWTPSVIVVDSVCPLLRSQLGTKLGYSLTSQVGIALMTLASKYDTLVLTTNSVSGKKPGMGDVWASFASTRILLEKSEGDKRVATILKGKGINSSATFSIESSGIH